jgi:hypothetical protein
MNALDKLKLLKEKYLRLSQLKDLAEVPQKMKWPIKTAILAVTAINIHKLFAKLEEKGWKPSDIEEGKINAACFSVAHSLKDFTDRYVMASDLNVWVADARPYFDELKAMVITLFGASAEPGQVPGGALDAPILKSFTAEDFEPKMVGGAETAPLK